MPSAQQTTATSPWSMHVLFNHLIRLVQALGIADQEQKCCSDEKSLPLELSYIVVGWGVGLVSREWCTIQFKPKIRGFQL